MHSRDIRINYASYEKFLIAYDISHTDFISHVSLKSYKTDEECSSLRHSFTAPVSYCVIIVCSTEGADKSLARPGRTQANVSVRMA